MNVTKYEHSCLVISSGSDRLVIDPGSFLATLPEVAGVVAIVITHAHADHFSPDRVRDILGQSPDARVFGPRGVADAAAAEGIEVEVVAAGDAIEVEPFTLRFFGETHNVIHSSIPVIDNVGVLVDDAFYYGGDSYTEPGVPVELLAAPVGAPWLKIGEAMDFVLAVAPRAAFPVHDMTLSVAGKSMAADRLKWATEQGGGTFTVLEPGESIDPVNQPEELTPTELARLLESGEELQLVDVRETWEAELAALPGAMLLPLGRLPELTDALDPDRPIVVYCHHGIRSAQAAAFLLASGFDEVTHLTGGIDAWSVEVDPELRRY